MPLIEVGDRAPAFALPDQDGKVRRLAEFRGRPLVIYFYPEDDTELCTIEACGFGSALPDLAAVGAVVVGVSPDDPESHRRFREKWGLRFDLLSDAPGRGSAPRVCERYGVWREKVLYGRRYVGMVRTTYLIDGRGRVARRWDHVRVRGHAAAVMEAVLRLERPENSRPARRAKVRS